MPIIDVKIPDIGDFKGIPIVEVFVKAGDVVAIDDPLLSIESDKATMEIPSPAAGRVAEILVKIGDKVSQGSPIFKLESGAAAEDKPAPRKPAPKSNGPVRMDEVPDPEMPSNDDKPASSASNAPPSLPEAAPAPQSDLPPPADFGNAHASPSVRRLARELDVDLTAMAGTGDKGRITKDDVKKRLAGQGPASGSAGIDPIPAQDFSKFGAIETKPLSRLKRLSGPHLHRAWLNIPHVTHSDEADISELETYRKTLDAAAKDKGYRVTLLAFLLKASVVALKEFPDVNASLSPAKDTLIYKHYYHLGVAVDTPDGLVVPVLRDVDRKGILELSQELGTVSARMRDGKIAPADIQGGTFSISSLGGIGGVSFTPIINAPELAILGGVRAIMKPVWDGKDFQPRLMLPLCLSYDHRVIDGAMAARFTRRICEILGDMRQLVL